MKYSIFLMLVFVLASCKDAEKAKMEPLDENTVTERVQSEQQHPGKRSIEQECYICHDPNTSMANRIAPPMEAIKRHYIDSNTTKEEFTEALIRWVNDPETQTKIPAAHTKFGPMPYMPISDDAVAQIADYIFDNELERQDWFDAHFQEAHKKGFGMRECNCFDYPDPRTRYGIIGRTLAKQAQIALGKNLKAAIQERGLVGAVSFCHTEATKLTDSISVMMNAIIKRVSDRPRNPNNRANEEELRHIASFKQKVESQEDIEPIVQIENDAVTVYYPITTNALCLQCHGKPNEQVQAETLATLTQLYPDDQAIGYDVNEVRGIWSIEFDVDN
ncbi:MAG: DUF3365 domain-containing protein [Pricia sp.]|nr:DUF3365 domain-containing protein [Pricia sp.]